MDPWIDEVVFDCGCCGMYLILGTGDDIAPTFSYTYENQGAMLRQAYKALEQIRPGEITAPEGGPLNDNSNR